MSKTNLFKNLKNDLMSLLDKRGLNLLIVNFVYLFLLLFLSSFFISAVIDKSQDPFSYGQEINQLKTDYQKTGTIDSQQGNLLLNFDSGFKSLRTFTIIVAILLSLIYASLNAFRFKRTVSILFRKKVSNNFVAKLFLHYILAFIVSLILLFLFINFVSLNLLFILLIVLLLIESFLFVYNLRIVLKLKKPFGIILLKYFLYNFLITIIFLIVFYFLFFLLSLISLFSTALASILFVLIFLIAYVKRQVILYSLINYL